MSLILAMSSAFLLPQEVPGTPTSSVVISRIKGTPAQYTVAANSPAVIPPYQINEYHGPQSCTVSASFTNFLELVAPGLDIDALGTGGSVIYENLEAVPSGFTGAIAFSVTPGTSGSGGTGLIQSVGSAHRAATIFGFENQVNLSGQSTTILEVALADGDLCLDPNEDVNSVDTLGTALTFGWPVGTPAPFGNVLYFSVTDATRTQLPAGWLSAGTPSNPYPDSGAAIFKANYDEITGWSVAGFKRPSFFGLTDADDIDAFAYDESKNLMLYSVEGQSAADPIMLAINTHLPSPTVGPYMFGEIRVSKKIGLSLVKLDDVDAISALDPGFYEEYEFIYGDRQDAQTESPNQRLVVTSSETGGQRKLECFRGGATDGMRTFWLRGRFSPQDPWMLIGLPTQSVGGAHWSVPVPANLPNPGTSLTLESLAIDAYDVLWRTDHVKIKLN